MHTDRYDRLRVVFFPAFSNDNLPLVINAPGRRPKSERHVLRPSFCYTTHLPVLYFRCLIVEILVALFDKAFAQPINANAIEAKNNTFLIFIIF